MQVKFISRFTKSKSDTHKIVVKTYNNDLIFCLFTEFRRSHSDRTGYLSLTTVLLQVVLFRRTACSNCKGDARGFSLPSWSIRGFSCKCLKSWVLVGRGRVPYCGIILSVLFSCDGVAFCRGWWCNREWLGAAQLVTNEGRSWEEEEGGGRDEEKNKRGQKRKYVER